MRAATEAAQAEKDARQAEKDARPQYQIPFLQACDRVVVSQDNTWHRPMIGWIIEPRQCSADIVTIGRGRMRIYRDCFYEDDPRVITTDLLDEEDRGVFKLAESELVIRSVKAELASQRAMLDQLAAQLAGSPKEAKTKPKSG